MGLTLKSDNEHQAPSRQWMRSWLIPRTAPRFALCPLLVLPDLKEGDNPRNNLGQYLDSHTHIHWYHRDSTYSDWLSKYEYACVYIQCLQCHWNCTVLLHLNIACSSYFHCKDIWFNRAPTSYIFTQTQLFGVWYLDRCLGILYLSDAEFASSELHWACSG